MEPPPSTLEDQVRRFRAGEVYEPSDDPHSVGWLRVIAPVVSVAADELENQRQRLDHFSLPFLPGAATPKVRASPARTARLFLNQLRSDFRLVAYPNIDLASIDRWRQTDEWASALAANGITNRSVAILAVGHYLASDPTRGVRLESLLKPWTGAAEDSDRMEWFESTLGPVVGPIVHLALSQTGQISRPNQLPGWASEVGDDWCQEFLNAGAQELHRAHQQVPQPLPINLTY